MGGEGEDWHRSTSRADPCLMFISVVRKQISVCKEKKAPPGLMQHQPRHVLPSQLGTAGVHAWGDSMVTMVTYVAEAG